MKNRLTTILISLAITLVYSVLLVIAFNNAADGSSLKRILMVFGGNITSWGSIQLFTFFLFVFGLLEINQQSSEYRYEAKGFERELLPEKDNWVLSPADVMELKLKMTEYEKREKFFLASLIRKTCTKYQLTKSTSEALEIVSSTVRMHLEDAESSQSLIRYVGWAIPSVGFIGTVIGIASSLSVADQATNSEGIKLITGMLNVAFDTTLVALLFSLVLMFAYHILQERVEKIHSRIENYVIENLINRIYHS